MGDSGAVLYSSGISKGSSVQGGGVKVYQKKKVYPKNGESWKLEEGMDDLL